MLPQTARLGRRAQRARHVARFDVWHLGAVNVPVDQAAFVAATERTWRRERSGRTMLALLGPLPVTDQRP